MNLTGHAIGGPICQRCGNNRRSVEHRACSRLAQTELKPAKRAQRVSAARTEALAKYLSENT